MQLLFLIFLIGGYVVTFGDIVVAFKDIVVAEANLRGCDVPFINLFLPMIF